MKRITLFISLLCMMVGTALAQTANATPQAGKVYRIKDVKNNKYLTVDKTIQSIGTHGDIPVVALDQNNAGQYWVLEATATPNQYKLKSKDGYYVKCSVWNCDANKTQGSEILVEQADATAVTFYLRDAGKKNSTENYFKVQTIGNIQYPFCDAPKSNADIVTWTFEEAPTNKVLVTYIYKLNNAEYQRVTKLQDKNSAAAAPAQNFLRLGAYSKANVGETDCEITVECTENLPFIVSKSFAEAKWQVVEMHRNGCYRYWEYGTQYNTINVTDFTNNREDVPAENKLWCFVGNLKDGFVIYNKAAGENMTVNAVPGKDKPYLDAPNEAQNKWYLSKSSYYPNDPKAVCFTHDKSRYMNQQSGIVHYWHDNDNGSSCFIDEAEDFILSVVASDMYNAHKIGAIGVIGRGTEEAKTFLAQYENVKNNAAFDLAQLQTLVASFKAVKNSNVAAEGPKAGYYFIYNTGVPGGGGSENNSDWRLTYNGTDCQALPVNNGQKLGAQHVWYLQASGSGFKMQSCNVGKFLGNLEAAPKVTPIASEEATASVYTFTTDNTGKFLIKDGQNKVLRTEGNGQVNAWGSESNERWYLVEATDLDLDITAAGYATVHFPFDVTLPQGVTAYAVEATNNTQGTVSLIAKTDIPANQGAIIKGAANQTHKLTIAPKSTVAPAAAGDWANNKLKGSNVKTYVAENAYVLAMPQGKTVGLYKANLNKNETGAQGSTHFQVNANRAYLPMLQSGAAAVQFYGFEFNEDGTTGIENIEDAIINNGNAVIFDLSGRRVQNTTKGGIYIVNGKKVVR